MLQPVEHVGRESDLRSTDLHDHRALLRLARRADIVVLVREPASCEHFLSGVKQAEGVGREDRCRRLLLLPGFRSCVFIEEGVSNDYARVTGGFSHAE